MHKSLKTMPSSRPLQREYPLQKLKTYSNFSGFFAAMAEENAPKEKWSDEKERANDVRLLKLFIAG